MISPVDSKTYVSQAAFEIERRKLFGEAWIFFDLKSSFLKPNDFVLKDIVGTPVVVHNVDGELIAYENTCPHKQAQLQWETRGRRPIACRFHGWMFGKDGKPKNIPHYDDRYKLSEGPLEKVCLRMFSVAIVGEIVFINLSSKPKPIEGQFEPSMLDRLKALSAHFDKDVLRTQIRIHANWKLPMEVIRDEIHPQFLHARTLGPRRAMPTNKSRVGDYKAYAKSESFDPEMLLGEPIRMSGWADTEQAETQQDWFEWVYRFGDRDAHGDNVIFPNTHIVCSAGGHSFSIENYCPISASETVIDHYLLLAKRKPEHEKDLAPRIPAILLSHVKEGQVFLDEDIAGVESAQIGMERGLPTIFGLCDAENFRLRKLMANLYASNGLVGEKE